MNWAFILQWVGVLGGLTGLTTFLNMSYNRKKLVVETDSTAAAANSTVVKDLLDEKARKDAEVVSLNARVEALQTQVKELQEKMAMIDTMHWDRDLVLINITRWANSIWAAVPDDVKAMYGPPPVIHWSNDTNQKGN